MLKTQPNSTQGFLTEQHILNIPPCCPVSKNPQSGNITISYKPQGKSLEVGSLYAYIHSFVGGYHVAGVLVVRDMEGMIQRIATDCADALGVDVEVIADLQIVPKQRVVMQGIVAPATIAIAATVAENVVEMQESIAS